MLSLWVWAGATGGLRGLHSHWTSLVEVRSALIGDVSRVMVSMTQLSM